MKPVTGTTPDPELAVPEENLQKDSEQASRGKCVAGADSAQAQVAQRPGGGGAPETGSEEVALAG
jgi:hypothetical protein